MVDRFSYSSAHSHIRLFDLGIYWKMPSLLTKDFYKKARTEARQSSSADLFGIYRATRHSSATLQLVQVFVLRHSDSFEKINHGHF